MPFLEIQLPSGHRDKIEVNNNSLLISVLEEICIKRNLDIDYCYLMHNKMKVDLSSKFGMSKLINNSKLELINSSESLTDNVILSITLQFPNNNRVTNSFTPKDSLWNILLKFAESNENASIIFPNDPNLIPVIYHFHDQIIGEYCLKNTSLASLGFRSGRALFRFENKDIPIEEIENCNDILLKKLNRCSKIETCRITEELPTTTIPDNPTDTNVPPFVHSDFDNEIKTFDSSMAFSEFSPFSMFPSNKPLFSDLPSKNKRKVEHTKFTTLGELIGISLDKYDTPWATQNSQSFTDFKFPEETAGKNLMGYDEPEPINFVTHNENRESVFFYRNPVIHDVPKEDIPDSFFEITEEDLRQIIKGYKESAESDAPLVTKAFKEQLREAKLAKYQQCIIQFHFQDSYILQSVFKPKETIGDLYGFVKFYLHNNNVDFHLYTTPPKEILKTKELTLVKSGLVPMSKIYVSVKATDLCIDNLENIISMGDEEKAREIVSKLMNRTVEVEKNTECNLQESAACGTSGSSSKKNANGSKVPKWFNK